MMLPFRFLIFLAVSLFSLTAWSLSVSWSGWSRVGGYYQHSEKSKDYYAEYHFVLQPNIHVVDGLNLISRFDLHPFGASLFDPAEENRQTGFVFLYGENSQQKQLEAPPLFLRLSQLYVDYQNEFFKVRLGRAPYHFGTGITYSASTDPFQHWLSTYNQVDLYLEYSRFYLQPAVLHQGEMGFLGLAQAGLAQKNWKASVLYQHDFKDKSSLEAFGEYQQNSLSVKAGAFYAFEEAKNMRLAVETLFEVPAKFPFQLEVKMGGAYGEEAFFHPNYDVALLFWNRQMIQSSENSPYLQIDKGQVQNGFYFSPRLLFSFFGDQLKLKPLFLFAKDLNKETFSYELDLEGMYQWSEDLFLVLKGGILYEEKPLLALLAKAAVSF